MGFAQMALVSPLALAVLAGSLAQAHGGARPDTAPWDPLPCSTDAPEARGPAWYRLDPVLDGSGTLVSRRLSIGAEGSSIRVLDLAPESFASGPVDGLVLAGEDDGDVSRLSLLDPVRGCALTVGNERDVVRSAVLAAGARHLYEHRVDRETRADLGIWRREIGGSVRQVLEGLGPDPVLGPTFVTDLILEADGRLVVSSCAQAACRVRVLDTATGRIAAVDGTGPALGVTGRTLVVRAACHGEPCPVDAVDLASGQRRRLAADAFAATLGGTAGDMLVVETPGRRIATIAVRTGSRTPAGAAGVAPLGRGSTAEAGAEVEAGNVPLAPRGRPASDTLVTLDLAAPVSPAAIEVTR